MKHRYTCLIEDEEIKIQRLSLLLNFLKKKEQLYFIMNRVVRFENETQSFRDNATDMIVAPSDTMIDTFYVRLCNAVNDELSREAIRSSIHNLRKLLINFNDLQFLPPPPNVLLKRSTSN